MTPSGRRLAAVLVTIAAFMVIARVGVFAQEDSTPSPAAALRSPGIRISFVPPPLEGSISLGVYDSAGKLVRVLHREADIDDFEIGSDALNTTWDGKNDRGESLPPGKYHGRGYVVGDLDVEGVRFFFNDWVSDEQSPRVEKIMAIGMDEGAAVVTAKLRGGELANLICDATGNIVGTREEAARAAGCEQFAKLAQLRDAVDCAAGRDQTIWSIERATDASTSTEVKQWSADGELLRRLAIAPEDPQPVQIAASTTDDRLLLLDENAAMQRVRALTLLATITDPGQAVSDWKVAFEKKITAHAGFAVHAGKPVLGATEPALPETVPIKLQPNPLQKDKRATLEMSAGFDAAGSFLQTADGLPLHTISETPRLSRIVVARAGDKSLDVFQDDVAVVEQFRISGVDRMMAFDCGDFELK